MINPNVTSRALQTWKSAAILSGMKNLAFEAVTKVFGSQKNLAQALGVTPGAVWIVVHGRRPVPISWCPRIEKLTDGKIVCEQLRPDVSWDVVRQNGAAVLADERRRK